jgi:DNA-directed RNA polymerase subunit RPC12/RpoP
VAKKSCSECGNKVGVRTKECPDCGHKFVIKKRGPRPKEIKWIELKVKDIIKVVSGTGPYFISKVNPGERIMLGEKGRFEVVELYNKSPRSCGIIGRQVTERGHRANTTEFIYMGESYYCDDLCSHNAPHKILGVETEATVIEKPQEYKTKKKEKNKEEVDVEGLNNLIASL